MRSEVYWINGSWPGRIAIVPRPRGGDWLDDEVAAWARAGLDVIVSLLEADEAVDLGLSREGEVCQAAGLSFLQFPIVDRSVPASRSATLDLVNRLATSLLQGKNIGIHCRQSVGRSSLIAASVLIALGMEPQDALAQIADARGCPVPETPRQLDWVMALAPQAVM
jgi:protein-tyrosine phosphatase